MHEHANVINCFLLDELYLLKEQEQAEKVSDIRGEIKGVHRNDHIAESFLCWSKPVLPV